MEIEMIRHNWPEVAGFDLDKPVGRPHYVFVHFLTPVEYKLEDKWMSLSPGDLIVVAPHVPHRIVSRQPMLNDWMHVYGDIAERMALFGLKVNTVYHMEQKQQITSRIARMEAEFFAKDRYWQPCIETLMDELWIAIYRQVNGRVTLPLMQKTADRLRELRTAMSLHPELPWTNEMMAQQVNISVSRLYPLYRRLFSISPGRDVILMRVEKAKQLIQQGHSVTETAELLGYSSTYHFIRQFRQEAGVTPGKWGK
ncbi:MAG: helix-turn-helix domain-containing protein [Clostridiales bacterium]|nr:helix-turn-helix domain-containing protein [Clostridiales bacterium]